MSQTRWNPGDYHCHSGAQLGWARELLGKLSLAPGDRVLDIGCGDGKVTAEIAAAVPRGQVTGIDLAAEMVRFARENYPASQFPNLVFLCMDAQTMTFQSAFNVAFSNASLHWVANHEAVLRGIRRALVPGGRILLQMGGRGNAAAVSEVVKDVCADQRWSEAFAGFVTPWSFPEDKEYSAWVVRAGLEPRRIELIAKEMKQPGREGFAGWLRTTWFPYIERVPRDLREVFLQSVMDEYLRRRPIEPDGSVRVAMVRLEVEAGRPADR